MRRFQRLVLRENGGVRNYKAWVGRLSGRLFSVGELVTDAPDCEHKLRVLRVVFDLGA